MKRGIRTFALISACVLSGSAPNAGSTNEALRVGSAAAFVDAIGINVHFHYTDTPYGDQRYPIIRDRLLGLGLHHLRDGMVDTRSKPFFAHIEELAQHGLRFDLIVPVNASPELIHKYPVLVPGAIESYEGANEYDLNGGDGWPVRLVLAQHRLYAEVRADPILRGITVIGPSFVSESAANKIGDLSHFMDYGNAHIYFLGRNPGTTGWGGSRPLGIYGSLDYDMALAALVAPKKPLFVTESGYPNDPRDPGAVPPSIAARYLVRILLDNWNAGIVRTYFYELVDVGIGNDPNFGLLNGDGSPKPAYVAVKNLIEAIGAVGISAHPGNLRCYLRNGPDVRATLLGGSAGRFMVAVWRETPGWSVPDREPLAVAPVGTSIDCDRALAGGSLRTFADDGTLSAPVAFAPARSVALTISDRVTLLFFRTVAGSHGLQ